MTQKTGFDAFFNAVTRSPEFRSAATKDWRGDMEKLFEKSAQELERASSEAESRAGNAYDELRERFDTREAREAGTSATFPDPLGKFRADDPTGSGNGIGNPSERDGGNPDPQELVIERFECKNPRTFGFEGIAGMHDLKKELRENFIAPIKFSMAAESHFDADGNPKPGSDPAKAAFYRRIYEDYKKFKVSVPTGLLFYGPPGTGKTFITKKLAEELGAGFIKKSAGEFGSSYAHATSKNIRAFFRGAKAAAENEPIILFLDEIDSLVSARTTNLDATKAEEVSQFLQEFNDLADAKQLIVIAATNRPDHLDPAILRSGRFDKKFYVAPPDFDARKELFVNCIEKEGRPHSELDYDELARLTEGYVSADIDAICDEVSRDASQDYIAIAKKIESGEMTVEEAEKAVTEKTITMDSLRQAIVETVSSLKMTDMSVYDQWNKKIS